MKNDFEGFTLLENERDYIEFKASNSGYAWEKPASYPCFVYKEFDRDGDFDFLFLTAEQIGKMHNACVNLNKNTRKESNK